MASMDGPFPGERRSVERRPGDTIGSLRLHVDPVGQPLSATARDISVQGIGLVIESPLDSGTALMVQGRVGKDRAIKLPAEVRHSRILPNGKWLVGCIFARILTMDNLTALG